MEDNNIYPPFRPEGHPLKYQPKELLEKFSEYVEWAKTHPIKVGYTETSTFNTGSDGAGTRELSRVECKPRLVSVTGFITWLGSSIQWWAQLDNLKRGKEFVDVKTRIRGYCEQYQLEMASTGIFKENIVARMLGLADKKDVKAAGDMVTVVVRSDEEKKKFEGLKELGV